EGVRRSGRDAGAELVRRHPPVHARRLRECDAQFQHTHREHDRVDTGFERFRGRRRRRGRRGRWWQLVSDATWEEVLGEHRALSAVTLAYFLAFLRYARRKRSHALPAYAVMMPALFGTTAMLERRVDFSRRVLWALSAWG